MFFVLVPIKGQDMDHVIRDLATKTEGKTSMMEVVSAEENMRVLKNGEKKMEVLVRIAISSLNATTTKILK